MVRLPRIRLRTLMIFIAVLAVGLGMALTLQRRSSRLSASAQVYGREVWRLERRVDQTPQAQMGSLIDRVHWNSSVSYAYRSAASQPWLLGEPDPAKIRCTCKRCNDAKMTLTLPIP